MLQQFLKVLEYIVYVSGLWVAIGFIVIVLLAMFAGPDLPACRHPTANRDSATALRCWQDQSGFGKRRSMPLTDDCAAKACD